MPTPTGLVVKNGSKIRSRTRRVDAAAVVGDLDADAAVGSAAERIRTRPPGSQASMALTIRFMRT